MNKLAQTIANTWYGPKTGWQIALYPLSLLFRFVIFLRRVLYALHVLPSTKLNVPVIVVGNITVGGTGKTPVVIELHHQCKQMGFTPGIVSRGYGGSYKGLQIVTPNSSPSLVGDEPALISRVTQAPLVVCGSRVKAAKQLINQGCDLIISDDGLQHYALRRDVEVLVIDGERRFGNGMLLPAGPLREPVSRKASVVDVVLVNGQREEGEAGFDVLPLCYRQVKHPAKSVSLREFEFRTVHAVAGLGNPGRFFKTMRKLAGNIIRHPFPDHHQYQASDFDFDDYPVVMTGKDAVKCQSFAKDHWWFLDVGIELEEEVVEKINNLINGCKPSEFTTRR